MKKNINHNNIEKVLNSFKPNESMSLSMSEKKDILKSVFDKVEVLKVNKINTVSTISPFYTYKTYFIQYLRYSLPVLLIVFIGTQVTNILSDKSKIALSDINQVKTNLNDIKRINSIKSNLSKNQEDIKEIKLNLASSDISNKTIKTQILADKVSSRSREIRNQVASLVSENKITEAKKIALDLESALKADELYKVSTSVKQEVFEAIDLRVDIEKKESNNISTSTEKDIEKRLDLAKKDILKFESNASTTDMIENAKKNIETTDKYLKDKDLEKAIISLQIYDRIVAELETILLP